MEEFIEFLLRRGILKVWCGYDIETIQIPAGNGTVISPKN
jgi:hypothetical protein